MQSNNSQQEVVRTTLHCSQTRLMCKHSVKAQYTSHLLSLLVAAENKRTLAVDASLRTRIEGICLLMLFSAPVCSCVVSVGFHVPETVIPATREFVPTIPMF